VVALALFASVVILAALACVAFSTHVVSRQEQQHAERLQLAHLEAASRVRDIVTECFDRIQSRSLVESVEAAHIRAQKDVAIAAYKDELAKAGSARDSEPTKVRGFVNGEEKLFDMNDLETM
jgi:uncharacterized membrane protein YhiD involved in acid resistance